MTSTGIHSAFGPVNKGCGWIMIAMVASAGMKLTSTVAAGDAFAESLAGCSTAAGTARQQGIAMDKPALPNRCRRRTIFQSS